MCLRSKIRDVSGCRSVKRIMYVWCSDFIVYHNSSDDNGFRPCSQFHPQNPILSTEFSLNPISSTEFSLNPIPSTEFSHLALNLIPSTEFSHLTLNPIPRSTEFSQNPIPSTEFSRLTQNPIPSSEFSLNPISSTGLSPFS